MRHCVQKILAAWCLGAVCLALASSLASAATSDAAKCEGQFQLCPVTGDCALDDSLCGKCGQGQLVCPITNECLDGGTDSYVKCPGLKGTWLDWTLDAETRAGLMSKNFTVVERSSQLTNFAIALPGHGIPRFQWLADNLHGVRAPSPTSFGPDFTVYPANGTMFPAGPSLGSTWNPELLGAIGKVIATESRALYNLETLSGRRGWVPDSAGNVQQVINGAGISVYSPNVNLGRDPRWGRIAEVFTEDAHLMNALSVPFVEGLQGVHSDQGDGFLTLATCKHAAVYDVEFSRQHYSAEVGGRAMQEFYLPSIEACTARGAQAMCSYNAINGNPACSEVRLLDGAMRNTSGFDGFVVSDYDAWADFRDTYAICSDYECAAAVGLKAGMDMEGGNQMVAQAVPGAIQRGLVEESLLDRAFERVMRARISLGTLDPPSMIEYNRLGADDVASNANLNLALTAARQGLILLKNDRDSLPLSSGLGDRLLVCGSAATAKDIPLGPYAEGDVASAAYQQKYVTSMLEGITAANAGGNTTYKPGCPDTQCRDTSGFFDAVQAAYDATAVVVVLNLDGGIEGEGHDRTSMDLPQGQVELVNQLRDAIPRGTPMVAVLMHGGVVTLPPVWDQFDAVLDSFYPGIYGGQALGEALFGKINPSGKLPVTVYESDHQLPGHIQHQDPYPSDEVPYSMGLTYKYFTGEPFLPFGFGLSYTTYAYAKVVAPPASVQACDPFNVTVTVTNTGHWDGDEIVQLYIALPESTVPAPQLQLGAFQRVSVKAQSSVDVTLTVQPHAHYVVHEDPYDTAWNATRVVESGRRIIYVGGGQPGEGAQVLTTGTTVENTVPLTSCPSNWTD